MLDELCAKAQLRERCWMDRATLSTFQAEVFSEHDVR
jgi:AMMECR1 domain-containing protein